jgi:outer membrane protein assembly factor BamB
MSLRGDFHSFPASDLVQFLAHSRKTGTLRAYDRNESKFLEFREGEIVFAVHQRPIPPLSEIIARRSLLGELPSDDGGTAPEDSESQGWDEVVSRALERRRLLSQEGIDGARRAMQLIAKEQTGLAALLLAQRRLTEHELRTATEPERIPDHILLDILGNTDYLEPQEVQEARLATDPGVGVLESIIELGILTRDEVLEGIAGAPDEQLGELLVAQDLISRSEVRSCLAEIRSPQENSQRSMRLGEFMVATGQVTRRQFERALEEQLKQEKKIGEILIDQGAIRSAEVLKALDEIESLRAAFDPMCPLRQKLEEWASVSFETFTSAVSLTEKEGWTLAEAVTLGTETSEEEVVNIIRSVVTEQLSDLLLWTGASFEFYDKRTLSESISPTRVPVIHRETFDACNLMLEAHSSVDELGQTGSSDISLLSVYLRTDLEQGGGVPAVSENDRIALQSFDGRGALRDVRQVIQGTRYSHFRLFSRILDMGLIRPLSRAEAFDRAGQSLEAGRQAESVTLLRHALRAPGDEPSANVLRTAILKAREHAGKTAGVRRKGRSGRSRGERSSYSRFGDWLKTTFSKRSSEGATQNTKTRKSAWKEAAARVFSRIRIASEEYFILSGWARFLWTLKTQVFHPVERFLPPVFWRSRKLIVWTGALVIMSFVFASWPRDALRDEPVASALEPVADAVPDSLHASVASFEASAPFETAPAIVGDQIIVAGRDARLRVLRFLPSENGKGALEVVWEIQVGEYGDILSRPVVSEQRIFLTNVRGRALAVSLDGHLLWERSLPRLEPLAPGLLFEEGPHLAGVTVASREDVHVLSPADGRTLYTLETGNRISTGPVGDAGVLFVGSDDNKIYRSEWSTEGLSWGYEESDDITKLTRIDDVVVFATSGGRLAALDSVTGEERWKKNFPRQSVLAVDALEGGHVLVEIEGLGLRRINVATGETESELQPDSSVDVSRIAMTGGRFIYNADSGHVGEIDDSGKVLWRSDVPPGPVAAWASGEGFLVVSTRDGRLVVYSVVNEEEE